MNYDNRIAFTISQCLLPFQSSADDQILFIDQIKKYILIKIFLIFHKYLLLS